MNLPVTGIGAVTIRRFVALESDAPLLSRANLGAHLGVNGSGLARATQDLLRWAMIQRIDEGRYLVPTTTTRLLMLIEPSAYHREILLLDDVYQAEHDRAFGCLPVRPRLWMELPHAILFLPTKRSAGFPDPPQVARFDLSEPPSSLEIPLPTTGGNAARVMVPVSSALDALSFLCGTGDVDFALAAQSAARSLGLSSAAVQDRARWVQRQLSTPSIPGKGRISVPAWLMSRVLAAQRVARSHQARSVISMAGAAL
jgi:hypothetical protein